MTPERHIRRDRMIAHSRTLWGLALFVQTCVLVTFGTILASWFNVLPVATSEASRSDGEVLWGLLLSIASLIYIQRNVWRPLHRLARDCMVPRAFSAHVGRISRLAFPYGPAFALVMSGLFMDPPKWAFFGLAAVLWWMIDFVAKRSDPPIAQAVDDVIHPARMAI